MTQAKDGDKVKVHYKGTLDDGTVFDSSEGREPLEFTLGGGMLIPGFEKAVLGMMVGDSKTEKILCENAYGPRRAEMVIIVGKNQFPPEFKPEAGIPLQLQLDDGRMLPALILDVSEENVTLDTNHPLAGENLTFDIKLVEIA